MVWWYPSWILGWVSGFQRKTVSAQEAWPVSWWQWEETVREHITPLRTNHSFCWSEVAHQRLVQSVVRSGVYTTLWSLKMLWLDCLGLLQGERLSWNGTTFFFFFCSPLILGPSFWRGCDEAPSVTWPVTANPAKCWGPIPIETSGTWRHSAAYSNWVHSSHCR